MELSKRKKRRRNEGFFAMLCSKANRNDTRFSFRLPHGVTGNLTQEGGTLTLVDITFCQGDCDHFRGTRIAKQNFPQAPPERAETIRMRQPGVVDPDPYVIEQPILLDLLPLPGNPTEFSQIFRSRRALGEDDLSYIMYTAGYRKQNLKSTVNFSIEDTLSALLNRISSYHVSRINQSYNNLLPTQAKIVMVTEHVKVGPAGKTTVRGKVTINLPPLLSLGFSEKFLVEGLGFDESQYINFTLSTDPSTQLYGFQNKSTEEMVITSNRNFNPNTQGNLFFTSVEGAAERFHIRESDHQKALTMSIATEHFVSSYTKKMKVSNQAVESVENTDQNTRALNSRSILETILEDVCVNLNLPPESLTSELDDGILYLRSKKKFLKMATTPYPNLTIHIQVPPALSKVLGFHHYDFRWDCVSELNIANFDNTNLAPETIKKHLQTPEGKKLSNAVKSSPKLTKTKLWRTLAFQTW